MPGMKVDSSKHEYSSKLNGIFFKTCLSRMLECNATVIWILFASFSPCEDTSMGSQDDAPLTKICVHYMNISNRRMSDITRRVRI